MSESSLACRNLRRHSPLAMSDAKVAIPSAGAKKFSRCQSVSSGPKRLTFR